MRPMVLDPSMFVNACVMMDAMTTATTSLTSSDVAACCSPLTGGVLDEGELAAFRAIAERHGLWLFADEIYSHFAYDAPFSSMITHMADWERTMVFGGFSKTYGVPGWRLGWVAGPGPILERMKAMSFQSVLAPVKRVEASRPSTFWR